MSPELIQVIIDAGGTGILLWLVIDMRREAREDRKILWQLLAEQIRANDSRTDIPTLPSAAK